MILAVAVLLFQFPAAGAVTAQPSGRNKPAAVATAPLNEEKVADSKSLVAKADDQPKITLPSVKSLAESTSQPMSSVYLPPPPAFRPPDEAPVTHRRLWILLSASEHSSAGFDAWSTRRALASGRIEADPMMRPFAGSAAIYGAIQVIPVSLDYVARRFQRSSGWTRHIWWVPQSAATATFLFSGSYNIAHTN